ncbi:hypothetical protein CIHG_01080 [Coccidioides immitis H538.4]|uniref:Uncharacterized protein n=1 Tax=Coccidioides immitis H538.4 TaxID=396776 RepID=A0A0J8U8C1_COCIT|nr:hypothetical protein CIHG_01080 [Coccidioides immitis H538.4]
MAVPLDNYLSRSLAWSCASLSRALRGTPTTPALAPDEYLRANPRVTPQIRIQPCEWPSMSCVLSSNCSKSRLAYPLSCLAGVHHLFLRSSDTPRRLHGSRKPHSPLTVSDDALCSSQLDHGVLLRGTVRVRCALKRRGVARCNDSTRRRDLKRGEMRLDSLVCDDTSHEMRSKAVFTFNVVSRCEVRHW